MQAIRGSTMRYPALDVAQLARDYYEVVFRFCARRIGQDAAADAAQETFLTAQRVAASFRGESSLKTWLLGIANNECRRLSRKRNFEVSTVPLVDVGQDRSEAIIDRRALQQAISQLSVEHREAVQLHEIEGLTYEEVAQVLGIPIGTVKSRLHHAFQNLRKALQGDAA